MWNAAQYLKYSDERSRPFNDLLSQVRTEDVLRIADLGCGAGNLTRTLLERWHGAHVIGVDRSHEMLAQAVPLSISEQLEFEHADIAEWSSKAPLDLIVSNAALQWLDDHAGVLSHWVQMLCPTGTLAVQMPNRFRAVSQVAIEETVADPRWATLLESVGLHRQSVQPMLWYVHLLQDLGLTVNAWETTYYHMLTGDNPVLEWLKGTALRPLLERLHDEDKVEFLAAVGERLKESYPARDGVTVFPMPRMFFVASR
ncbi:methyltransferase domain-containing protein [Schlesneria paludicola]|uniref:methyltransferase domain-containing protein n=1 Tax=Schlesneria paludicola TaxID=360056 RepID=UPI00029A6038|nr:methyltransferase domain-containing protein [Schlesneria paludicola]